MDKPTEKQINYAGTIARTLRIDLPKEFTKQAYWEFINKNKTRFENRLQYNSIIHGHGISGHGVSIFADDDPWSPESVYDASWFC